jgi:methylated-DNA-[protein]-cysteine S-methyltransferase
MTVMKFDPARFAGTNLDEDVLEELLKEAHRRLDRELRLIRRPPAALGITRSPLGDLLVATSDRGIVLNHYVGDAGDIAAIIARLRSYFDLVEDRGPAKEVGEQVRRYLAGEATALDRKIDLTLASTAFHKKVLTALMAVPRGAVLSYQALGAAVGAANASRAIGNAMHNNPVPVYVPCHRVIASGGGIGGYGGGIARKLRLLRAEGFAVKEPASRLGGDAVWGDRQTRVYCRSGCVVASRAAAARMLLFANEQAARTAGMRPCRICSPV